MVARGFQRHFRGVSQALRGVWQAFQGVWGVTGSQVSFIRIPGRFLKRFTALHGISGLSRGFLRCLGGFDFPIMWRCFNAFQGVSKWFQRGSHVSFRMVSETFQCISGDFRWVRRRLSVEFQWVSGAFYDISRCFREPQGASEGFLGFQASILSVSQRALEELQDVSGHFRRLQWV